MTQKQINWAAWTLFSFAMVAPFVAWGTSINWDIDTLSVYKVFPLLGLWAWMIMWTHYVIGATRLRKPDTPKPKYYGRVSAYVVLTCLLLHPGLLAYEQWQNGAGFPPLSFIDYVGESLRLAVMFGSLALTLFLSFEIFDRIKDKPRIKSLWWAISISQSIAMMLIFVHALRLGTRVASDGWFSVVWIVCGLILLPCFYLIHTDDFKKKQALDGVQ